MLWGSGLKKSWVAQNAMRVAIQIAYELKATGDSIAAYAVDTIGLLRSPNNRVGHMWTEQSKKNVRA